MANNRDFTAFAQLAYGMWVQCNSVKEQGATLQDAWAKIRDDLGQSQDLFLPEHITAFTEILTRLKQAGKLCMNQGSGGELGNDDGISMPFAGWYPPEP